MCLPSSVNVQYALVFYMHVCGCAECLLRIKTTINKKRYQYILQCKYLLDHHTAVCVQCYFSFFSVLSFFFFLSFPSCCMCKVSLLSTRQTQALISHTLYFPLCNYKLRWRTRHFSSHCLTICPLSQHECLSQAWNGL